MNTNPVGIKGLEFIEFCSSKAAKLHNLFIDFGFSKIMNTANGEQIFYKQNDVNFILNLRSEGHSFNFCQKHGPSITSMAWRVENAAKAFTTAVARGAKPAQGEFKLGGASLPAVYGIGESIIYFVDQYLEGGLYEKLGFFHSSNPQRVPDKGFLSIDHLTNNVEKGTMEQWVNFYKNIFAFTEVRTFDIRGAETGLTSYALKSPCETFCIPINEGTEKKSQINEFLEQYKGPGIQHLAFLTDNIVKSLDAISSAKIETLEIDDYYYDEVFNKVKNVTEDHQVLRDHNILIDGDDNGYLLQIFTKNLIGPIFFEIIQRKNYFTFGEGNFGTLFRSIEKDQQKRGYLE